MITDYHFLAISLSHCLLNRIKQHVLLLCFLRVAGEVAVHHTVVVVVHIAEVVAEVAGRTAAVHIGHTVATHPAEAVAAVAAAAVAGGVAAVVGSTQADSSFGRLPGGHLVLIQSFL